MDDARTLIVHDLVLDSPQLEVRYTAFTHTHIIDRGAPAARSHPRPQAVFRSLTDHHGEIVSVAETNGGLAVEYAAAADAAAAYASLAEAEFDGRHRHVELGARQCHPMMATLQVPKPGKLVRAFGCVFAGGPRLIIPHRLA